MKYLLVFCFLWAFVSCNSSARKKQNQEPEKPLGVTQIKFDENNHDFGKLKSGEIVVYTFSYTNVGKNDYLIDRVETDCGCTTANFEKKLIKPGERGEIEVELSTAGMIGREFKSIDVFGNSKDLKHLVIFAEVENEMIDIKH